MALRAVVVLFFFGFRKRRRVDYWLLICEGEKRSAGQMTCLRFVCFFFGRPINGMGQCGSTLAFCHAGRTNERGTVDLVN